MPTSIITSRPITARLGSPLIVLLSGITLATTLATVWIPAGPPPWANGVTMTITITMAIVAAYLNSRPSRVNQPHWAKTFVIATITVAILAPLAAIVPAIAFPTIGYWIMATVTLGELGLLTLTTVLVTMHRQR
jgi:hypothetical protein